MKKLSMFMAMVMCATLALSGCGNSVSDDRAEAYASLSSMTSLDEDQAAKYKEKLTSAPDSAAIKSVLAEAKATNDREHASKVKADAKEAADSKIIKKIEAALVGRKMVGGPTCSNMTLVFNADKTWSLSSSNEKDICDGSGNFRPSPELYPYWRIWIDTENVAFIEFSGSKEEPKGGESTVNYQLTLNGDGTVTLSTGKAFMGNDVKLFTSTK